MAVGCLCLGGCIGSFRQVGKIGACDFSGLLRRSGGNPSSALGDEYLKRGAISKGANEASLEIAPYSIRLGWKR